MKKFLTTSLVLTTMIMMADAANAAIPLLNYKCADRYDVHADQGGPVYINGREAKLKVVNKNYYEATGSGITVSISINPDGSATVSYTGPRRANGICEDVSGESN